MDPNLWHKYLNLKMYLTNSAEWFCGCAIHLPYQSQEDIMAFFSKPPAPSAIAQVRGLILLGVQLGVVGGVARIVSHNTDKLLGKLPGLQSEASFKKQLAEIKATKA